MPTLLVSPVNYDELNAPRRNEFEPVSPRDPPARSTHVSSTNTSNNRLFGQSKNHTGATSVGNREQNSVSESRETSQPGKRRSPTPNGKKRERPSQQDSLLSKIYDHNTNKAFVKKSELKRLKMYRSNSAERIKDPRGGVDVRSQADKRRAQNRMLQQHMDRANRSMIENLEDEEVERLLNEMSNLKDSLGPDEGSILTTENDSRPRTSRGGSRIGSKGLE